jgi:hypothetical protein
VIHTKLFFLLGFTLTLNICKAQLKDSMETDHHGDRSHTVIENQTPNKLWGNSWQFSASCNFADFPEADINIGRTFGAEYCSGAGCIYTTRSWGLGYGLQQPGTENIHLLKTYAEACVFYFPPFSAGIRADYLYDINNKGHFFRPAAGLSFIYLDIFYNYTFRFSNEYYPSGHGITVRVKYYFRQKNWQKSHPSHC